MTEREALKLALEALEYIENNYMSLPAPATKAITAIKEALAQPEQEQQIETLKRCLFQMQEAAKDLVEQAKSLTPPQRTWVGLTADELNMIGDSMRTWNSHSLTDVYVAIEAKLKEKNT